MSGVKPYRILIDVSRTDDLAARMERVRRFRPDAVVGRHAVPGVTHFDPQAALTHPEFRAEQRALAQGLDDYFDTLDTTGGEVGRALSANRTLLFDANLIEIHKWLFSIRQAVGSAADRGVVAFVPRGGARVWVPLYEAEGETTASALAKWLYHESDFLPAVIANELQATRNVAVRKYIPGLPYLARPAALIRQLAAVALPMVRAAVHLRNGARHRKSALHRPMPPAGSAIARACVVTRGAAHTEYLESLVAERDLVFLVADSFVTYPRNAIAFAQTSPGATHHHLFDAVTNGSMIRETGAVVAAVIRGLGRVRRIKPLSLAGLGYRSEIDLRYTALESIANELEPRILARALDRMAGLYGANRVIHCEMFSQFPYYIAEWAERRGGESVQVAFGTYELAPTAKFWWADRFYAFSPTMLESLRRVFGPRPQFRYAGNLLNRHVSKAPGEATKPRTLIFFTQPIENETERRIVAWLRDWCRDHSAHLLIALHPREPDTKYAAEHPHVSVVTHRDLLPRKHRLAAEVDVALTRSSNVGYAMLLHGVPLINVHWSSVDAAVQQEYYPGYPLMAATPEELEGIFRDFANRVREYHRFRERFIPQWVGDKGPDHFLAAEFQTSTVLGPAHEARVG